MRWERYRGVANAAASYLLATVLTRVLWVPIFHRAPFPLFFAATAVAAWFAGFWPGVGVALLGAITACALMGEPGPEVLAAGLVSIGVATVISYLTERSRGIESELEEANELLNTVLDQAPVGIALFDRQLRLIRINDALAAINGLPAAAHLGKTASEVLPGVDDAAAAGLRQVLSTGESLSRELSGEAPAAPGKQRHLYVYLYPLRLRGEIIGAGAVCEDVTSKRLAAEELRQAKEAAEAASETKDRFLATLSHELRTPLTPVLAIASVMEGEERLPGYVRKHLAMIRRNVELEARLIDDLLDLTCISRGKIELRRESADAHQLIEDALRTCCQQDIDSGRVRVDLDLEASHHQVWADASRLSQAFWNLLNNAMKFTPDGGRVEVRTRDQGGELEVTIRDFGVGIEPARLTHIFDAFNQRDRAAPSRAGGLGLGLAICRAIVELHGGTISAESAGKGAGSTFSVRIPLAPGQGTGQEAPPAAGASRFEAAGDAEPGAGLRILLVEDHGDTAAALADLLSGLGHEIVVAGSKAAALAAVQTAVRDSGRASFDLVISDLGLPDGNGQELMRELAGRYGLKGIALSGYGMDEDREKSLQAGFSHHLTKPVHLRALQAVIRDVVPAPKASSTADSVTTSPVH